MSDSTVVMTSERVAGAEARAAARRFSLGGGGAYLYLLPSLVFLALFTYYPIGFSAYLSQERQDAAWKFIEWMTSSENAAQWSMASGYVATRKSAYDVPAMKEFLAKDTRYLVAREQLQYASGKMMAPNFQKIREILKKQLDDAVDGKVTPKEAMVTVQKQVEAVIKR